MKKFNVSQIFIFPRLILMGEIKTFEKLNIWIDHISQSFDELESL